MRYTMRQNIVYFYIYVSDIKLHFLMLKKSIGYVSSIACRYPCDITISLGGVFALKEINTLTF